MVRESAGSETCGSGPSGLSTGRAGSYSPVQLWHPCYTGCKERLAALSEEVLLPHPKYCEQTTISSISLAV